MPNVFFVIILFSPDGNAITKQKPVMTEKDWQIYPLFRFVLFFNNGETMAKNI